jgi:cysteine desulfurase
MIYLDHNATSPLGDAARDAMLGALAECGNASSVHAAGRTARARVEAARVRVARLAGAEAAQIVFTGGGSEANALALKGAVAGAAEAENRITRLFVSAVEHESVRANAHMLAETVPALKLGEIPVNADGRTDLSALRLLLMQGKGRALVSVMAANNETGVVQDIPAIAALVLAEGGGDALLHVDAVQAAGRMALAFADWGVDYLTLSAHKIGGPQGVGALVVRDGAPLVPLIAGGGQEMRRRAGTENVAGIAGFGAAADEAADFAARAQAVQAMRDRFERDLLRAAPDAVIFGVNAPRLPNTSNFAIPGLSAETALIALDLDGVAVSSGSACSSGTVKPSHVLAAMNVTETLARGGLRVSFGAGNSHADSDALIAALAHVMARRAARAAA